MKTRKKTFVIERDEPVRASYDNGGYTLDTSAEKLARLRPAFDPEGAVTAGNAPGLNDGAAALVLMSRASRCCGRAAAARAHRRLHICRP